MEIIKIYNDGISLILDLKGYKIDYHKHPFVFIENEWKSFYELFEVEEGLSSILIITNTQIIIRRRENYESD